MNRLERPLTTPEQIQVMKAFTQAHSANSTDLCRREAECMRIQFRAILLPPREGELLVGRREELPIGFFPEPLLGGIGFYINEPKLRELGDGPEIDELIEYWRTNATKAKLVARYDEDIQNLLSHGPLDSTAGVAWPLYRMAGSQADPSLLLSLGIRGMIARMRERAQDNPALFGALEMALEDIGDICLRYADAVSKQAKQAHGQRREDLSRMAENLRHISSEPPQTLWQAMQLSHLYFVLTGSYNYGRPDEYLGDFLDADLRSGELDEDGAYRLVKELWHMVIERGPAWNGRIALGGKGRRNEANANRFAMLGLRAQREHHEILPQLTLRIYDGMDPALYDYALDVLGDGCTYPLLYNDDVNIPAVMRAFGVDEDTAERYLPFGCGEYILYGQSYGTPSGAINLLECLNNAIADGALLESPDFEAFYQAYIERVRGYIRLLARQEKLEYDVCGEDAPFLYLTMLYDDCVARAKPIFAGGVRHLGGTLETYGNTNTSDSLTAICQLVYERRQIEPRALMDAMESDFEGHAELRAQLLGAPKYGNDDPLADGIASRLHDDVCTAIRDSAKPFGLDSYLNVTINNSMNTTFGLNTSASADGRLKNTFMANANNPTGGMDRQGITAMLNSLVKLRVDHHAGSVQNMRFSKEMFQGLLPKTRALLGTYFASGGSQAMISVLGRGDLEAALEHPEKYQNLLVRVGGFSARFVDLDGEVQKELLSRTLY